MNFLDLDLNELQIYKQIETQNGKAAFSDLHLNAENAKKIIHFLKSIGIINIGDLLVYELDIFLNDYEEIKNIFNRDDIQNVVTEINNDVFSIESYL